MAEGQVGTGAGAPPRAIPSSRRRGSLPGFGLSLGFTLLYLSLIVLIPLALSTPLLAVSAELALPPVVTYSDNVLYNWTFLGAMSYLILFQASTWFTELITAQDMSLWFLLSAAIIAIGLGALHALEVGRRDVRQRGQADGGDSRARRRDEPRRRGLSVPHRMPTRAMHWILRICRPAKATPR